MNAKDFVEALFSQWEEGDSAPFFAALAPDVIWTAKGTTHISGTFHGKEAYLKEVYQPLLSIFSGPTRCQVKQIIGEGDTVAVEWHGETPTASFGTYSQDYCWLIRVGDNETMVEVTGYFDTALVNNLLSTS